MKQTFKIIGLPDNLSPQFANIECYECITSFFHEGTRYGVFKLITGYQVIKPFLHFQVGDIVQEVKDDDIRKSDDYSLLPNEILIAKELGAIEEVK